MTKTPKTMTQLLAQLSSVKSENATLRDDLFNLRSKLLARDAEVGEWKRACEQANKNAHDLRGTVADRDAAIERWRVTAGKAAAQMGYTPNWQKEMNALKEIIANQSRRVEHLEGQFNAHIMEHYPIS